MILMLALHSVQGTACSETALCIQHFRTDYKRRIENQIVVDDLDAPIPGTWYDATDNEALECSICGYRRASPVQPRERSHD